MYFVILCKQNNLIMFHLPENIKVTESLFTTIRKKKAREIDDNKTTRLIVLKHREPTHRHTHTQTNRTDIFQQLHMLKHDFTVRNHFYGARQTIFQIVATHFNEPFIALFTFQ